MNKRAEIVVISAIIMLILTSLGVYFVYDASHNLYVGNADTHQYMDYFKCKSQADSISKDKLIVFKSEAEAISSNYNKTIGCV